MSTILIKNGLVCDGTDKAAQKKDVLVKGTKIAGIGSFSRSKAEKVIDAGGSLVAPGFINTFTSDDHHLTIIEDFSRKELLKQGITTVIGGSSGFSLAPFSIHSPVFLGKSRNLGGVNITWYSIKEFLKVLDRIQIGVNFGTLAGYSVLRSLITMGEPRNLTDKEYELFKDLTKEALKEGALGVSIGADEEGFDRFPYKEISDIAGVLEGTKKVLAVQVHNLRSELSGFFEEIISIGDNLDVSFQFNQLYPTEDSEFYRKIPELFREKSSKLNVSFDCGPLEETHLPAVFILPSWIRDYAFAGRKDVVFASSVKDKLVEHFKDQYSEKEVVIDYVADPSLKFLENKKLAEVAANWEKDPSETLWEVLKISGLKSAFKTRNIAKELLTEFLKSPFSFIASCDPKAFTGFLRVSQEEKLLDLEKAVKKTSAMPAEKYGLKGRGVIKEGNFADLVVIRDFKVVNVVLGGKVAVEDGEFTGEMNGGAIKERT